MRGGCVEFGDWGYWLVQGWFRSSFRVEFGGWWMVGGLWLAMRDFPLLVASKCGLHARLCSRELFAGTDI